MTETLRTHMETTLKKETLELFYNRFCNEWHLRDLRGNHIGTMMARADAERYAVEMGYRLKIHITGDIREKAEWFNG